MRLHEIYGRLKRKECLTGESLIELCEEVLIMAATQADLAAAIVKLQGDVAKPIAATAPAPPVDLQPQVDAVNAIDATVVAATPAAPAS